ncbi:MAG: DUF3526 domain-containing protein [Lewinella sp.]|nr:DUF3526 domain-containing protein [Lewinella sp.]
MLLGLWLALVFVVPSGLNTIINQVYPVPSQLLLINEQREAAMEASLLGSQLLVKYIDDHPELMSPGSTVDLEKMDATRFATIAAVEAAGQPIQALFDQSQLVRHQFAQRLSLLSPAYLVLDGLNTLAGVNDERIRSYEGAVNDYRRQLFDYFSQKAFQGQRLKASDYEGVPDFMTPHSTSHSLNRGMWFKILVLLASGLLPLLLGANRLQDRTKLFEA